MATVYAISLFRFNSLMAQQREYVHLYTLTAPVSTERERLAKRFPNQKARK